MGEIIWHDGRLLSPEEALCSCRDRGLLYGDGLFETMRVYRGQLFRLADHLARLLAGTEQLHLRLPLTAADLRKATLTTLAASGLAEAYLRLTVTRGVGGAPSELQASTPSVTIWVRPFSGYPAHLYHTGMSAVLATSRRNEHSPLARLKTLNYLDNLLARAEAQQAGADEALFLNTAGSVTEASASNLFIVAQTGRILTPPLEAGVLPGITRACVIELARAEGLALAEEHLSLNQLRRASEAFLTNSLMGIMPLTRFEGQPLGSGEVGPITAQMAKAYRRRVDAETGIS